MFTLSPIMPPIDCRQCLSPIYIRPIIGGKGMARARHGSFLFKRDESDNWWIKLRSAGKRVEKSLGTTDRAVAELLALPMIADHKARLLAARPTVGVTWQHEYEPGREHPGPDGGRIIATERELMYLDKTGRITIRGPNGGVGGLSFAVPAPGARPSLPVKNSDDAIFETYLQHKNITGHFEHEARNVWALYKTLTNSKPFKDADRDDGRKLVAHFEGRGLKSATIEKKIAWLKAAVNLAIKEGRLKFNPFSSVVPKRDDKVVRLPLDESDMKAIKSGLDRLDAADRVLLRVLATTGCRLSEAFEIDSEATEKGIRFCTVGHKTPQSLRRLPLPAGVLPHLPKVIKGPLFDGTEAAASKRLNRFLRDCGIADSRKVVHSLRHRAKDRLRAEGCPLDVQYELLGHETKTVASGYGRGSPVPLLRQWIDKIGF
jgi:integrase